MSENEPGTHTDFAELTERLRRLRERFDEFRGRL